MSGWKWNKPVYPRARLPGIYVDTVNPPPVEALPRMDIAVFAGFAASGPCHRAIAVDSVAAFEAVFGGDITLAFDSVRGENVRANLAGAVRAFFSNGGKLCWVIRLAMTPELAQICQPPVGADKQAKANIFPLSGVLARMPNGDGSASDVRPARLMARSLGSWSDELTLAARIARDPVDIDLEGAQKHGRFGFSFVDPNGLSVGDMIEFSTARGDYVRYAKIVRTAEGRAWAGWVASFIPPEEDGVVEEGLVQLIGRDQDLEATFTPDLSREKGSWIAFADKAVLPALSVGQWLRFYKPGSATWLLIDSVRDGKAFGRAWRQVRSLMPEKQFSVCRVTMEIEARRNGASSYTSGLGLCPEAASSIHSVADDDRHYASTSNRTGATRPDFAITRAETDRLAAFALPPEKEQAFGTDAFTVEDRIRMRTGWLPLGLGSDFGMASGALPIAAPALARDGLASNDTQLFIDPRLGRLSASALVSRAEDLRNLSEEQLFGMHAAIDIPGDMFSPASILALPDAALPEWEESDSSLVPRKPEPGVPDLSYWLTHRGGCPPKTAKAKNTKPDRSQFLDHDTIVLKAPKFERPPAQSADGQYELRWIEAPEGTRYVLEESRTHDFEAVLQLVDGENVLSYAASARQPGIYYYRLRLESGENSSAFATCAVVVRSPTTVSLKAEDNHVRLRTIHVAMLRLAAGTGDFFALLSLPRNFRADAAAQYARALAHFSRGFGPLATLGEGEDRALSYGALYHPWLSSLRDGKMVATAPDGAIAGLYATRATNRGAWIAPANQLLTDIAGLDPALSENDLLTLDQSRVNTIRALPQGFAVMDGDTLSGEADWRQINVRRLMMLIRRAAMRRGMVWVFEPNGPVVRRAIDRSFSDMLDDLQRRGAFSGKRSEDSFRISFPETANDRDIGRVTVEIAVSPSIPLRFLTLRIAQQGSRLTIAEAV